MHEDGWIPPTGRRSGGGISVIGRMPGYVQSAQEIGANYFEVPAGEEYSWAANQQFLDEGIANSNTFRLATPLSEVPETSVTNQEIQYLLRNGYRFNFDGTAMLPGGG